MRIGFCGVGGSGKSTVAEQVSKITGLPYLSGVARGVFEELKLTEDDQNNLTPDERWGIQRMIFDRKIVQDEHSKSGVFDRTLLDHHAYCLHRCADCINDSIAKSLEILVGENLKSYHYVFYFPVPTWDVASDGLRQEGRAYRLAVDCIIRGLLGTVKFIPWEVPLQDPQERVKFVMDTIGRGLKASA